MHPRQVARTTLEGFFPIPIGIRFLDREVGISGWPKTVVVSTVQVDGGHLEDPLNICDPETGYETMTFLDGCSFFSVHTAKYETREAAAVGHIDIVRRLEAGTLPLSIPVGDNGYQAIVAESKSGIASAHIT